MSKIFEPSQVLIKKQQPEVSGLGVATLADQNSGLPWTHVYGGNEQCPTIILSHRPFIKLLNITNAG
jgi:hypothetical protein